MVAREDGRPVRQHDGGGVETGRVSAVYPRDCSPVAVELPLTLQPQRRCSQSQQSASVHLQRDAGDTADHRAGSGVSRVATAGEGMSLWRICTTRGGRQFVILEGRLPVADFGCIRAMEVVIFFNK